MSRAQGTSGPRLGELRPIMGHRDATVGPKASVTMANEPVALASPLACCPMLLMHGDLLRLARARNSTVAVWCVVIPADDPALNAYLSHLPGHARAPKPVRVARALSRSAASPTPNQAGGSRSGQSRTALTRTRWSQFDDDHLVCGSCEQACPAAGRPHAGNSLSSPANQRRSSPGRGGRSVVSVPGRRGR